ncbi:Lipoteichoic acid synthase 2 [Planctomycetes bacterium Pla163]|uniref:Lipoteichoic acid synthase 2 n=1 Tax=Rohdeia mirabilis TaxID=2528008 RepID=A0A518CUX5_9BACT|nr:Lipoteichoic acid synthase 2 [Planctomycetes bacterium Pla163]
MTLIDQPPAPATAPGRTTARAGLLTPHLRFLLLVLAATSLSRLGLTIWQTHRISGLTDVWNIVSGGLRMDLLILSYMLAPAFVIALVAGGTGTVGRWTSRVLHVYFVLATVGFLFLEIITPAFIMEYDSRPNRLFVEYLVYPVEVGSMLLQGYRLEILITTVLSTIATLAAWKLFSRVTRPTTNTGVLGRIGLFLLVAPLIFLGARSSLKHRPANPSSVAFSQDHLLNELCLSSFYSVAYAVDQMQHEADAGEAYGRMSGGDEEVFRLVRESMTTVPAEAFVAGEVPTQHQHDSSAPRTKPYNLVILLEESLGAQYVGALGGEPVTQFLDTLQDEGWWFDNLYATGTRSVRGIEAMVSSFLPTPARSVVKLGMSQTGFFTIADYLGRKGYRTQFIYGGESHFDNMKSFFSGNGFQEIIDQDEYENPKFAGSWGVCDEDILDKTHEMLMARGDEPLFTLAFSVSNHSPWEYPQGDFELYDEDPATVRNTVRYADYALGQFFERARTSPYWDDTIFVIVADHDSRVYGASLVPIEHFHIPAVILGGPVEPRRDGRIASQIDLPPTLMSLIGVSGVHPMIGTDLTKLPDDAEGRAIMQYGANQAYMAGDRVVVHQPRLPASHFTWTGSALVERAADDEFERTALAHALLPSILYKRRIYHLPEPGALGSSGAVHAAEARVER